MPGARMRSSRSLAALMCATVFAAALTECSARTTPQSTPTPRPTLVPGLGPTAVVPPSQLGITYVDNDCFLLIADDKKILVDAHEEIVSRKTWTAIQEAQPPFDGVDLILITHNHADHFDAKLVGPQLLLNPNAVLATTQEVADALKAGFADYGEVQDRVTVFSPKEGERVKATLNGIEIEAVYLSHDDAVFNLGFIIRFGGKKLLHTGDTYPPHLLTYDFPNDNLDIAFIPYFWLVDTEYLVDGRCLALDSIQAKQYIPMHYSENTAYLGAVFDQIAGRCPNCVIFREGMETYVTE
jgi:L-ascorbate metabolism protein UlaG (beta-lactamase superfamily)